MNPLAYLVSKQIYYEKNKNKVSNFINVGASTEKRQSPTSAYLPHLSNDDQHNFMSMFRKIKLSIRNLWKALYPVIHNHNHKSYNLKYQKEVNNSCQDFLTSIISSHNSYINLGPFLSMTFLQFASAMGLCPHVCITYGHISSKKVGSYKFFNNLLKNGDILDHKALSSYNETLNIVTRNVQKTVDPSFNIGLIENCACELGRKRRSVDVLFKFKFRNLCFKELQTNTKEYKGFKAGMQNFYIIKWCKRKHEMMSFIRSAKQNGTCFENIKENKILSINGHSETISIYSSMNTMPYNIVKSLKSEIQEVRFINNTS